MRRLSNNVARLTALSRMAQAPIANDDGRLGTMSEFGPNPGELEARTYVPAGLAPHAPLVVVLHGCTQNAAVYDQGSGWSRLAERHGFALLFPEQRRSNNPNLCFNWFSPADARRGRGEAKSIRSMIARMVKLHGIDEDRIFINGLSAGGAMTSVMLAAYPELFNGGAVIAGLPFATANSLPEALERMRGQGGPEAKRLGALVSGASDHRGPWPTLSVWHGTGDSIVDPVNADDIVDQWRGVHGVADQAATVGTVDGQRRELWIDADGREVIEKYEIKGMGHGIPLDPRGGAECGRAGPHMLDMQICSTSHIARFWGLTGDVQRAARPKGMAKAGPVTGAKAKAAARMPAPRRTKSTAARGVQAVIEDALRAAGLMR